MVEEEWKGDGGQNYPNNLAWFVGLEENLEEEEKAVGKKVLSAILWMEEVLEAVEEEEEDEEGKAVEEMQPFALLCLSCQRSDGAGPGFTQAHLL